MFLKRESGRSAATQRQQSSAQLQSGTQSNGNKKDGQKQSQPAGNAQSTTAANFASPSQGSREPNRVEDRPVFGVNYQIEGQPAWPKLTLHPSFRAAGPKDPMIGNFVKAVDKMAAGEH